MADWKSFNYSASDGLILSGRVYGVATCDTDLRAPLICLPDYFKNANEFHEFALAMSTHPTHNRMVYVFEARGRGDSSYDKNSSNYNIVQECNDLLDGMIACNLGHADFVTSPQGALMLFNLTGMKPGIISSVVINDVGPEIEAQCIVRTKNNIANMPHFSNWEAAAAYWKAAEQSQFSSFNDEDWLRLAKQFYKETNGKIVYDFDSKLIDNLQAIDLDTRLIDMWPQFCGLKNIPVLLIHGENSDFLNAEKIIQMRKNILNMEVLKIRGQGHAPDFSSKTVIQLLSAHFSKAK